MNGDAILLTIDSLRADHVGCYGYDRNTTPTIDKLASEAHRFTNAFSHECYTRASFPAILTSSHAQMYGGFERLSKDRSLVSEVLSEGGYQCGGFHSNLYLARDFGYGRGFDAYYDSRGSVEEAGFAARIRQFVTTNLDSDNPVYKLLKKGYDLTERHAGVDVGSSYVTANDITDRAIKWLKESDSTTP